MVLYELRPSSDAGMRASPNWQVFEAVAPTLAYDHAFSVGRRKGTEGHTSYMSPAVTALRWTVFAALIRLMGLIP
jgi:hypothetical protein